jgi:hypothetical protein
MNRRSLWALVGLCCACVVAAPAVAAVVPEEAAPAEATPELQLPGDVHPTRYVLNMEIAPERAEFRGSVDISVTLDKPRQVLWLHGRELKIEESSVKVGAETFPAKYEEVTDEGVVKLTLPKAIGPGTRHSISSGAEGSIRGCSACTWPTSRARRTRTPSSRTFSPAARFPVSTSLPSRPHST